MTKHPDIVENIVAEDKAKRDKAAEMLDAFSGPINRLARELGSDEALSVDSIEINLDYDLETLQIEVRFNA